MASEGRKNENFTILEDIYHDDLAAKPAKTQIKEYFSDPKRIEKLLSVSILAVGLVALLLGLFQIKDNLSRKDRIVKKTPAAEIDRNDLLGQKTKDTDEDGLSDYDELYVYKTSPFLKDSDSDGFEDRVEVIQGTDPVCPSGQNCFANWSESPLTNPGEGTGEGTGSQSYDPAELRELLSQAGMDAKEIELLSDEQIIEAYQRATAAQNSQDQAFNTAKTASVSLPLDQLKNLTAGEIRELLQTQANIPQETLDKITDEELMALVNETLADYNSNAN